MCKGPSKPIALRADAGHHLRTATITTSESILGRPESWPMPKRNHRRALEQLRLKLKLLGDPPPPTEPDSNAAWAAEAERSLQAVRATREVYDRFPKSPEAKHAYDAAVKRYLEAANRVTPPRVIEGWERL